MKSQQISTEKYARIFLENKIKGRVGMKRKIYISDVGGNTMVIDFVDGIIFSLH